MDEERYALRLDLFEKAHAALCAALAQPEDEFVRDSIIKRFELTFETARKAMRQWLVEQGEVTPQSTKKEVMEAAFRVGLLGDGELWNRIVALRNDSSHEYDADRAIAAAAFARAEAAPAFAVLLQELKRRG